MLVGYSLNKRFKNIFLILIFIFMFPGISFGQLSIVPAYVDDTPDTPPEPTGNNMSCVYNSTHITLFVLNNFSTSSLRTGEYKVQIRYNVPQSSTSKPPLGGGASGSTICGNGICETGETELNCPIDCAINFTVEPHFFRHIVSDNTVLKLKYLILNYDSRPININIKAESTDGSHKWFKFYSEDVGLWVDELSVNVMAGSTEFPGRKEVDFLINITTIENDKITNVIFSGGEFRIARTVELKKSIISLGNIYLDFFDMCLLPNLRSDEDLPFFGKTNCFFKFWHLIVLTIIIIFVGLIKKILIDKPKKRRRYYER